ncbi:hypothetical protein [Sphingomonas azotifigens]|uniref:hypothetical protein n=1 Tax=Sphingomonas azotifigens TaxID=330920 RepID=UPI000A01DF51|nr:hypothetical protein [Sphingomonas azotifigens]
MADNVTTPVADGKVLAFKDLAGILFAWNLIADAAGQDAMGLATASPAANTLLGRLKAIADLLTSQNGYVDGLEALQTTANQSLAAIVGYVDGLETLQGAGNATLATIAAAVAASTPAGEAYIGRIGGDVLTAPGGTPAVATTAYAAGNVVGSLLTFTGAARAAAGSGLIQAASVLSKSVQTAALDLLIFSANPSASTFTDKATVAINAADLDKLVGVIHLTDWSALGTASIAQAIGGGLPFKLAAGTSLYGVLVARAAMTLASTSDLTPSLRIIPG